MVLGAGDAPANILDAIGALFILVFAAFDFLAALAISDPPSQQKYASRARLSN